MMKKPVKFLNKFNLSSQSFANSLIYFIAITIMFH